MREAKKCRRLKLIDPTGDWDYERRVPERQMADFSADFEAAHYKVCDRAHKLFWRSGPSQGERGG